MKGEIEKLKKKQRMKIRENRKRFFKIFKIVFGL